MKENNPDPLDRFEFKGTLERAICTECKYISADYCLAFKKKRNTPVLWKYITDRDCPKFEKVLQES